MMLATNLTSLYLLALLVVQGNALVDGISLYEKGQYVAAEAILEKAVQTRNEPRARAFLALSRAAIGHCEQAIPELRTQLATNGDNQLRRLTGLGLAQCYVSAHRFEEALGVLSQLKSLYPADEDVLYDIAKLHMEAWNDIVHEMYLKVPASFRVNQLSAEIFLDQGKYAEAVGELRKAVTKNPKVLNLHFELGRALLMSSHSPEALPEAEQEFQAELALNPSDAVAEYEVAQILIAEQKPQEALPHLERSVRLNPNFPEALIALGKAYLQARNLQDAITLLERAVQMLPDSEAAHFTLMTAYRNAGRLQDALREKAILDKIQKPPEGEFTEFLKKLGEKPPQK